MTGGNWNGKDIGSGITGGSVSNTGARRVLGVAELTKSETSVTLAEQALIKFNCA